MHYSALVLYEHSHRSKTLIPSVVSPFPASHEYSEMEFQNGKLFPNGLELQTIWKYPKIPRYPSSITPLILIGRSSFIPLMRSRRAYIFTTLALITQMSWIKSVGAGRWTRLLRLICVWYSVHWYLVHRWAFIFNASLVPHKKIWERANGDSNPEEAQPTNLILKLILEEFWEYAGQSAYITGEHLRSDSPWKTLRYSRDIRTTRSL